MGSGGPKLAPINFELLAGLCVAGSFASWKGRGFLEVSSSKLDILVHNVKLCASQQF